MSAWKTLEANATWCHGKDGFPLPAYSEYLPPPWLGTKPYGVPEASLSPRSGDYGWEINEFEVAQELHPGQDFLARTLLKEIVHLGKGNPTYYLTQERLKNNPYWPASLASRAGQLPHERFIVLLMLALSRTQDDKGRVRWTLFGSSEQGPAKGFWRGFFTAPGKEVPRDKALAFFAEILTKCYGVADKLAASPKAAGVRILSAGRDEQFPYWNEGPLPSWTKELTYEPKKGLAGIRYLLTFRPFANLPADVREAYLKGDLHLWPFPGSLVFWGMAGFRKLAKQLPFAQQLGLATIFPRCNDLHGLRIPQAGYLDEKATPQQQASPNHRPTFVRSHRWQKVQRYEDETAILAMADPVTRVLFSTEPDDIALYNKPMARNVQVWTRDHRLVLDGPNHSRNRIAKAEQLVAKGGTFGYRFLFPPMRVGLHEVYYHRPLLVYPKDPGGDLAVVPVHLQHGPTGYLTAYRVDRLDIARPVELWPVFPQRPDYLAAIELYKHETSPRRWHTIHNLRMLLEWSEQLGRPLTPSLADALVDQPKRMAVKEWLAALPRWSSDPIEAKRLAKRLGQMLTKEPPATGEGLTFACTATRVFEEHYWKTIAHLAHGRFRNKCNADCARDKPTREALASQKRELDLLARFLGKEHERSIASGGVEGAWVGEQRFSWRTDFDFKWMGGWLKNQRSTNQECNLIVRIPGRNAGEAVILADHYDTAYMHDQYYLAEGGTGARQAAAGADDNHSATAMLLLAAPILLRLSQAGKLACDVWLVHLTGEEFPSDCLGARHLAQALVQGTLSVRESDGTVRDLSKVRIRGLYDCDMIAHNNPRSRYVFQLAPGEGAASARLAEIGHEATLAWNALAQKLNRTQPRKGALPATRSEDAEKIPPLAPFARLRDEVRLEWDPRSTLFNTDGQIFSDVGVPVVLFMEDYDINRKGYHDRFDTMGNIDLDYGAAVAAIAIEAAARAAQ